MNYTTKFNKNDEVFGIVKTSKEDHVICEICNGLKTISINNKTFQCPSCLGRGYSIKYLPPHWQLYSQKAMKVGLIRIEDGYRHCRTKATYKEQYMLKETGVGSGPIWDSDRLFSTKEEALEKCECWNKMEKEYFDGENDEAL